ncbi:MAG: hypothetical protein AB7S38_17530 [Vulcanimicrobiota bacterium]
MFLIVANATPAYADAMLEIVIGLAILFLTLVALASALAEIKGNRPSSCEPWGSEGQAGCSESSNTLT